jgi:hypothetical protein
MRFTIAAFLILLLFVISPYAALSSSTVSSSMRPYSGIGVLRLPAATEKPIKALPLYEFPGLSRLGVLEIGRLPRNDRIFNPTPHAVYLIVVARKGSWLRVDYDDAGREAWLNPGRSAVFQPWELFLKDNVCRMLPGLQKKYYQLYQSPGRSVLAPLTAGQFLKVLRLEDDWVMVLSEQNQMGWVRWRDEDGRLLIGVSSAPEEMQS